MTLLPRRDEFLTEYCGQGLGSQAITGLLRILLTDYFSHPENILKSSLKDRIYKDTADTGIVIESAGLWKPETAGKRPAILIRRGELRINMAGLYSGHEMGTDPERFDVIYEGSHNIICIAKTVAETEDLTEEVMRFLINISPVVISELPIARFSVVAVSPVSVLEEARTHWRAAIALVYRYTEKWNIARITI